MRARNQSIRFQNKTLYDEIVFKKSHLFEIINEFPSFKKIDKIMKKKPTFFLSVNRWTNGDNYPYKISIFLTC